MATTSITSPLEVTFELNASGLHYLKPDLEGATEGYSNSRTCEIGLTMHSGLSYKSIVYLVDKATTTR